MIETKTRRVGSTGMIAVLASLGWGGTATCAADPVAGPPEIPPRTVEWHQWRGPNRDGRVAGNDWPDHFRAEVFRLKWRVPLAEGYSGPIVTGDRVFTAETKDRKVEIVRALSLTDGKELWNASWEGSMLVPFFAAANGSWIRSTPAWDGETLYVAGMKDVLVALDGRTGKERGRVDFTQRFSSAVPSFGCVCSPLVDGDRLFIQTGAGVVCLDRRTLETRWRALPENGGMYGSPFSSPTLGTLGGKRQLFVQTRTALAGLDPDAGNVLWSQPIEATRGMNILTPTRYGDAFLTSAHGGKTFLWMPEATAEGWIVKSRWEQKAQGYMSSPIVIGDHAYLHLKNQRAVCIDLRDGKETWSSKPFGQYWSMVSQGDKILALDERGELILFKADPTKFDVLDRRKISESPTWGHVAYAAGRLYVRELEALAVYEWAVSEPAPAEPAAKP